MKTNKPDNRPRFGFCWNMDDNPQFVYEKLLHETASQRKMRRAVAVIPLPFMSAKIKAKVRAFAKTLHP